MKQIFGELDHRLSIVPRWGILHTIQHQSVAEHVFNVERIALRIAARWFGYDEHMMFLVMEEAHHHEDLEALTGDLPTMVKPYFDEARMERDHSDLITPRNSDKDEVFKIVKLADKLEGYHFLCIENQLGNRYITAHLAQEPLIIAEIVEEFWPNNKNLQVLVEECMQEMYVERSIRHSKRGR